MPKREPRTIRLKSPDYKPTKAELEEPITLPTKRDGARYTPEEVAGAILQPVRIVHEPSE